MLQFSVYARYCASEEMAVAYRHRVRAGLPPEGYVRVLAVTDHQFGKMESYIGEKRPICGTTSLSTCPFLALVWL